MNEPVYLILSEEHLSKLLKGDKKVVKKIINHAESYASKANSILIKNLKNNENYNKDEFITKTVDRYIGLLKYYSFSKYSNKNKSTKSAKNYDKAQEWYEKNKNNTYIQKISETIESCFK